MDPVTASLALKAAVPVTQGIMGYSAKKSEQERAKVNSYIGRTRAIQTDTTARQGLSDELASIRNVFASAGQAPGVGTFEVMQELRNTRDRERRITFGNRMNESRAYSAQANAAGSAATGSLLGGFVRAGPSLFDLYDYKTRSG